MILAIFSRILFALLAGTWSDQHGRKGLLLLTVLGQLLASLSLLINYVFLKQLDWRFLFLELAYDLCGGSISYYMMEYSYITDITQVTLTTLALSLPAGDNLITDLLVPGSR